MLKVIIDQTVVDIDSKTFELAINYQLEDFENFGQKKGSDAFNIDLPATTTNNAIFNGFSDVNSEDNSPNGIFKGNRNCVIEDNGTEILNGKAFLIKATHTDKPTGYTINAYGGNSDWMITLEIVTLYDVLKTLVLEYSLATITNSWGFTGRDLTKPYVFAPAKYSEWLDPTDRILNLDGTSYQTGSDDNVLTESLKPALSVYYVLFNIFKHAGYSIKSTFCDTDYFRKTVMPWTWSSFLSSEGTKFEIHRFSVKSVSTLIGDGTFGPDVVDLAPTNKTTQGMFDNNTNVTNGDYTYVGNKMTWTYNAPHYGTLDATFQIDVNCKNAASNNALVEVYVHWFKNGTEVHVDTIASLRAPLITITDKTDIGVKTMFWTVSVNNGDVIAAEVWLYRQDHFNASAYSEISVATFSLAYFRIPLNTNIVFDTYVALKEIKVLDFVRGLVDTYNLQISTDPINKEILIEPLHNGYQTIGVKKWSNKQDLLQESTMSLYSDQSRQYVMGFKKDGSDGMYKLIEARAGLKQVTLNLPSLGESIFAFSERFKVGSKETRNRFFSATMHYTAAQFKSITGIAPQLIVIVPESIGNASSAAGKSAFLPKLAYYKGITADVGGWKFNGVNKTDLPYMFAVNYKYFDASDPVLSYSDELITNGADGIVAHGLFRTFFLQRFAIMENGQFYNTFYHLDNIDASASHHRELIETGGQLWELVQIQDYKPNSTQSTKVSLRKWVPLTQKIVDALYPSLQSIHTGVPLGNMYDFKYNRLMCLPGDVPKPL